jgi:hypothetical protein
MPERNQFVPPSIALGSIETTLWDMTTAFATYMNDGMRVDPHIVQRVTNSAGQELYVRPPYRGQRLLDEDVVHSMNSMMGAVVLRGTGAGARIGDATSPAKPAPAPIGATLGSSATAADLHRRRLGRSRRLHLDGPHHRRHAAGANLGRHHARRAPRRRKPPAARHRAAGLHAGEVEMASFFDISPTRSATTNGNRGGEPDDGFPNLGDIFN